METGAGWLFEPMGWLVNRVYVAGGIVVGGALAIGALLQVNFFGLFEPKLEHWQQPPPRELVEVQGDPFGLDDLEGFIAEYDEKLAGLFEEGPPAYSQAEADAWVAELMPIVERVCARNFKSPPVLRVVDRPALAAALSKSARFGYEDALPAMPDTYRNRLYAALAAMESVALLGMYDPLDKVLYAVPTNVRAALAAFDVDARHYEPFVKLVVAHELTHALQDQHLGLAWWRGRGPDARHAFRAAIEGHAVFVQERVAAGIGIDDTSVEISRMLSAGNVPIESEWFDEIESAVRVLYEEIYLGGRDFIAHHHEAAGMDGVWRILEAPPAQTSMIASPGTYAPKPRGDGAYPRALSDVDEVFGRGWRTIVSRRQTALDMHGRYASLEKTRRDRHVASIEIMHVITLRRWWDVGQATLHLIVLREVEPYDEIVVSSWSGAVQPQALLGLEADVNLFVTGVREGAEDDRPRTRLCARRGRLVVELSAIGGELSDEDYTRIVESLLDRLKSFTE